LLVDLEATADYPGAWEVSLTDSSGYRHGAAAAVPIGGPRAKLFLPWESFARASRWGSRCQSCTLDRSSVSEVSLYLLYQEGNFRLLVHSIRAVREPAESTHPRVQLTAACTHALLKRTIQMGVAVWNKDYQELCAAVYESTLRSIAEGGAEPAERALACRSLAFVSTSPYNAAWAHRRAMDALLHDEGSAEQYPSFIRGGWLHHGSCTLADTHTFFDGYNWCNDPYTVPAVPGVPGAPTVKAAGADPESASDGSTSSASLARQNGHFHLTPMVQLLLVTIAALLLAVAFLSYRNSRKPKVIIVSSAVNDEVVMGRAVNVGEKPDCANGLEHRSFTVQEADAAAHAA
jgi:hypothetical protein